MKNIGGIKGCFGCGVCAISCGKKIISIEQNADGFYEPRITDTEKCTNCGLCAELCAYSHENLALNSTMLKSYAAWSKDSAIRRKCSSGGVGFEVGKFILAEGGKVCGVRYDAEKNQAEHYVASNNQELIPSIGSKYIQSYTVDGFAEVAKLMRDARKNGENAKFLVTGAPCQIDSFLRWAQKFKCEDQFVFLDFFCHGVPSKLMWNKYVQQAEKQVGKLTYVSWRNKFTGWHDSWTMAIDGEKHGKSVNWHDSYNFLIKGEKSFLNSRLSQGDIFYRLFLSDACLGKACYDECRFKYEKSSADIRIGDMWGSTYSKNEDGVNGVLTFTELGDKILHKANLECVEHSVQEVGAGQMRTKTKCPPTRELIMNALKNSEMSLQAIYDRYQKPYKYMMLPIRVIKKLKRLLHVN